MAAISNSVKVSEWDL